MIRANTDVFWWIWWITDGFLKNHWVDFYRYRTDVYTHFQHTFMFKQLVKWILHPMTPLTSTKKKYFFNFLSFLFFAMVTHSNLNKLPIFLTSFSDLHFPNHHINYTLQDSQVVFFQNTFHCGLDSARMLMLPTHEFCDQWPCWHPDLLKFHCSQAAPSFFNVFKLAWK